ncbi:MAG: H-type lectin domain-containing protein [Arenibacterium sp.]
MKRLRNYMIGVAQGDTVLFSDFEDGGDMWTGTGPRERRRRVVFDEVFKSPPTVQVAVSLWDVDTASAMRAELVAEAVTEEGFDIVFRTWLDTRFARIRVAWTALGEVAHEDDWDLY